MTNLMTLQSRRRRPLTSLFDEVFEDLLAPLQAASTARAAIPAMNVAETAEAFRLAFELPGVQRKDINLHVDGDQLVVTAERRFDDEKAEGVEFHRVEHRYGSFTRSVTLPKQVRAEAIEATLDQGVLTILVPKAEPSQARRIEIRSS
jgi:HSP20 family protein